VSQVDSKTTIKVLDPKLSASAKGDGSAILPIPDNVTQLAAVKTYSFAEVVARSGGCGRPQTSVPLTRIRHGALSALMEMRMSTAVVLTFPHARTSELDRQSIRHVAPFDSGPDGLTAVRLDIRQSLLLLDIALFRLRTTAPARALELFSQELATIDELLESARTAARQI
jgi:hypothetical protein